MKYRDLQRKLMLAKLSPSEGGVRTGYQFTKNTVAGETSTSRAAGLTDQRTTIDLLETDFIAEFLNWMYNSLMNLC